MDALKGFVRPIANGIGNAALVWVNTTSEDPFNLIGFGPVNRLAAGFAIGFLGEVGGDLLVKKLIPGGEGGVKNLESAVAQAGATTFLEYLMYQGLSAGHNAGEQLGVVNLGVATAATTMGVDYFTGKIGITNTFQGF